MERPTRFCVAVSPPVTQPGNGIASGNRLRARYLTGTTGRIKLDRNGGPHFSPFLVGKKLAAHRDLHPVTG
jgi:hypothetical protein